MRISAKTFADFFLNKITIIRDNLQDQPLHHESKTAIRTLSEFSPVTSDKLRSVIMSMETKSCELDSIPTHFLKQNVDAFLPILTHIANNSLTTGMFASSWKIAVLRPLLKKDGLDRILKNYRPVSNLPFISKLIEKCVTEQILEFCMDCNTYPQHQSAYVKNRSCETSLISLFDTLLWNMENGEINILVAIDLSAAFDTVDHSILLNLLENRYGLDGKILDWFDSYLQPRGFKVCINNCYSDVKSLTFSVPQGSCGGPIYYNLYAGPIIDVIPTGVALHGFADDHTIVKSYKPDHHGIQEICCLNTITDTLENIHLWMNRMRLKMNDSKTEYLMVGSRFQLQKSTTNTLQINGESIAKSDCIRLLGVLVDRNLSMESHVKKQISKAMHGFLKIKSIRHCLDQSACEILVYGLIISHLDYCNGLLYGVSDYLLHKMQVIQNMAARLVLNIKDSRSSATDARYKLHWLPIQARIEFKIITLMYQCKENIAAPSLQKLVNVQKTSGRRSGSHTKLSYPIRKA